MADFSDNNSLSGSGSGRIKKYKRTWDFVCVSNDGKIIHFSRISRKVAASAFVFALIIIYSSVLSFFYIKEKKELTILTSRFINMEASLQDVSRERDGIAAKLAMAEANVEPQAGNKSVPEINQKNIKKEDLATEKMETSVSENSGTPGNNVDLAIENFSARRINASSVNLRFVLKSTSDIAKQYKGYIVSAIMPSGESSPSAWKFAKGIVHKDGIPENPEKGHYYVMKGEKEITVRLKADSSSKAVKTIVFDDRKNVLAEGVIQIESASVKPKKEPAKNKSKRRHK